MLEFTDRPKAIRVHRREKFSNSRTPVATLNKLTLSVGTDPGIELSEEETATIQEMIELLNKSVAMQRHVWTLKLPECLREAVEYCGSEATDAELNFLATAVAQAQSRLTQILAQRKAARLV